MSVKVMRSSLLFFGKLLCAGPLLGCLFVVPHIVDAEEAKPSTLPERVVLKQPTMPQDVQGVMRSVNERLSVDVAPAENAAVLLVQILGEDVFESTLKTDSLEMLGIDSLSSTPPPFLYFQQFVDSLGKVELESLARELETLPAQLVLGCEKPWKSSELPGLFAYLSTNRPSLDLLVEASKMPKYYAPVLSDEDPPQLLSISVTIERRLPFLARCLCARAMLRIAEQNAGPAINDLLACQRLDVLLAVGSPFDVSGIKAHQMDGSAFQASVKALQSGDLKGPAVTSFLEQLKHVAYLPASSVAADQGERAVLHRQIELLKQEDSSIREFFEFPDTDQFQALGKLRLAEVDWDRVQSRAEQIQNQVVSALATQDRHDQNQQFAELDDAYAKWDQQLAEARNNPESLDHDLKNLSLLIGETMARSLLPSYRRIRQTDDRGRIRRDLLLLSLALVVYRADHEGYPTNLSDLTPQYLTTIPLDATGNSFKYGPLAKEGVRLTSFGPNLTDDAGLSFNDDIVIELP